MGASSNSPVRVYVNGSPVDVATGGTALDAVTAWDPSRRDAVSRGERAIVDSRGLPIDPQTAAYPGAIYRLVRGQGDEGAA